MNLPAKPHGYQKGSACCSHCGQRKPVDIIEKDGKLMWVLLPHDINRLRANDDESSERCPGGSEDFPLEF